MLLFLFLSTVLLFLAAGLSSAGLFVPAALLFPLPVGRYWAAGQYPRSLALVAVAAIAAYAATGSAAVAAAYVLVADLGLFLGVAALRHWSFGSCVAVVTAVLFGLGAGNMLLNWSNAIEMSQIFLTARINEFEELARQQAEAGREVSEGNAQMIEVVMWVKDHVHALVLGTFFGGALLFATGLTWVYQQMLRQPGGARIGGAFVRMRPPEWLVWLAIALAGLWLIDYRWPNELLRSVTWNAALGLSFVYWLNGLSIVAYVLLALHWHPVLVAACMGMLMAAQLGTMLSGVGLFDTWYGFRERIDRLVAARNARERESE